MHLLKRHKKSFAVLAVALCIALAYPTPALSLPNLDEVVHGSADFSQEGDTLTITVNTPQVIANFNSYSIAANEAVSYIPAASLTIPYSFLNRVIGTEASIINGSLSATGGSLVLVNPNGITFGPQANVNVASLIASTLDITDQDFLAGKFNFQGEGGLIINEGLIEATAPGGFICLLSGAIKNIGTIKANLGTVMLATGEAMTLALDIAGDISVVIDEAVKAEVLGPNGERIESAVDQKGNIIADGGAVKINSKILNDVFDYAINNTGIIEANVLACVDGKIFLTADGGPVLNAGEIRSCGIEIQVPDSDFINADIINASGCTERPDGGNILIEALNIMQSGTVSANASERGTAGRIELIADNSLTLDECSLISASCAPGVRIGNGGIVLVNSTYGNTVVKNFAVIDVSAGSIEGDAGFADISACKNLEFNGILLGSAPSGYRGGIFILDPESATIGSSSVGAGTTITYWTQDDLTITGDVSLGDNATLNLFADHNSDASGDWHDGVGAVLNPGDYAISADVGAADTYLNLEAGSGIGTSSHPIITNVHNLSAEMNPGSAGDIYVDQGSNTLTVSLLSTTSGNIDMASTGSFTIESLYAVNGDVTITNNGLDEDTEIYNVYIDNWGGPLGDFTVDTNGWTEIDTLELYNTNIDITNSSDSGTVLAFAYVENDPALGTNGTISVEGNGDLVVVYNLEAYNANLNVTSAGAGPGYETYVNDVYIDNSASVERGTVSVTANGYLDVEADWNPYSLELYNANVTITNNGLGEEAYIYDVYIDNWFGPLGDFTVSTNGYTDIWFVDLYNTNADITNPSEDGTYFCFVYSENDPALGTNGNIAMTSGGETVVWALWAYNANLDVTNNGAGYDTYIYDVGVDNTGGLGTSTLTVTANGYLEIGADITPYSLELYNTEAELTSNENIEVKGDLRVEEGDLTIAADANGDGSGGFTQDTDVVIETVGSGNVDISAAGLFFGDANSINSAGDLTFTGRPSTIQSAIDAIGVVAGTSTINLPAGIYNENITIDKSLVLNGAQAGVSAAVFGGRTGAESIIDGQGTGHCVRITANNVVIDGFDITNSDSGFSCVHLDPSLNDITVSNNKLSHAEYGVWADSHCQNVLVEYNAISDCSRGVYAREVTNDEIAPIVRNNHFYDCVYGIKLYHIYHGSSQIEILNNYFEEITEDSTAYGIYAYLSSFHAKENTFVKYGMCGMDSWTHGGAIAGVGDTSVAGFPGAPSDPWDLKRCVIEDNVITAWKGSAVEGYCCDFLIKNNTITQLGGGYDVGLWIRGGTGYDLGVGGAEWTVENTTITGPGSGDGIFATGGGYGQSALTLDATTISGFGNGVRLLTDGDIVAQAVISESFITGNDVGVLVTGSTTGVSINDNDLSGNTTFGVSNTTGAVVDASGNWWGANTPAGVAAEVSADVDYTPWLDSGVDTDPATPGFQGDFSYLHVDDSSPQTGATGRIREGIDLVSSGGTVILEAGTYTEDVTVSKPVAIISDTGDYTTAGSVITGASRFVLATGADGTTIQGLRFENINIADGAIFSWGNSRPDNVTIRSNSFVNFSGSGPSDSPIKTGGAVAASGWLIDGNKIDTVSVAGTSGLWLLALDNATISNNVISNVAYAGMILDSFTNCTVSDNTISNTARKGIQFANSPNSNSVISGNYITNTNTSNDADEGAITIYTNVTDLLVTNNILTGNFQGFTVRDQAGTVAADVHVNNNSIYNNTGAEVANYAQGGGILDASGNWLGSNNAAVVGAEVSANVDYTPWLDNGVDTDPGTPGFQGDYSVLWVDDASPQSGADTRTQEAVDLTTLGGTVNVEAGTYGSFDLNRNITTQFQGDATINGNIIISDGNLVAPPGGNLSIAGDFNHAGGLFTHNNGTVIFYDNSNPSTISGDTTFNNLTCATAGKQLNFEAGSTQTVLGDLTLTGVAGNLVELRSTVDGTQWMIDPQGGRTIGFVDVKDSFNVNAAPIDAVGTGSVDSGNNIKWMFAPVSGFTWVGSISSLWNVAGNWFGGSVPGVADVAVFSGAVSIDDCDININAAVDGIDVASNYLGTITQLDGSRLTVGVSDYIQAGGNFVGGNRRIDVNGDFILSGGTFTSTSERLRVWGDWTHTAGGTFNHSNGRVVFLGADSTINVDTSETFYDLRFNSDDGALKTIAAGDTVIIEGELDLRDGGVGTGTLEARGNVVVRNGFDGGDSPLVFAGNADQDFDLSGAAARFDGAVTIDKSNGQVNLLSNLTMNSGGCDLTVNAGTLNLGDNNLNVQADLNLNGGAIIHGNGTVDVVDFNQVNGTFTGGAGNIDVNGNYTLSGGAFTSTSGRLRIYGDWDHALSGSFVHNSGLVAFRGGDTTIDVMGTETFHDLRFNANNNARKTITAGDTLISEGVLDLRNGRVRIGTLEVQGDVVVRSGFDGGRAPLVFTGNANQTFNLTGAAGRFNGDVRVNKTGGQVDLLSNFIANANNQDLIIEEGTFDINGHNLTVSGAGSTFIVEDGGNLQLQGAEACTMPTLNAGSTVTYDGSAAYASLLLGNTYSNLTFNGTGSWQHTGLLDVNGNLTILQGTLDSNGQDINLAGNWLNLGNYTSGANTVTLDGTNQTISGSTTFNNLTKIVVAADTLTFENGETQMIRGTMDFQGADAANLLSLRSDVAGQRWMIDPQGTRSVRLVDVKDSNNVNLLAVTPEDSIDSGNNINWIFGAQPQPVPPVPTPETLSNLAVSQLVGAEIPREYEKLDDYQIERYQLYSIDTSQPLFFFYHPLTPVDESAFDSMSLDVGAYEFIENMLKVKGTIPHYFGLEAEEIKKAIKHGI